MVGRAGRDDNASGPQLLINLEQRAGAGQIPDPGSVQVSSPTPSTLFLAGGIRMLASLPQAPRANAICERMIGTLRRELLDRIKPPPSRRRWRTSLSTGSADERSSADSPTSTNAA